MDKSKKTLLEYLYEIFSNKKNMVIISIALFLTMLPFSSALLIRVNQLKETMETIKLNQEATNNKVASASLKINLHVPEFMQYKEINQANLKAYLEKRNSVLSLDNYLNPIIESSREFNLNPLVLLAIAGHEQGFVPKDHPQAELIANNPFNVFQSWERYNTNIVDSSQIAARTVVNLLKDREPGVDPFRWINRKYAQDENWYKGVKSIYFDLEENTK